MSASPVASPPHEALDDTEAVAPSSPTAEAPAAEDAPVEETPAEEEAGSPAAAPAGGETLYNDVFGGDGSDLSDMSDNDDDGARRSRKSKAADAEVEGANDDENDENDTYQPATATSSARIPSFKKNRAGAGGEEQDGDDDDDAPAADEDRRRRKNKRKERRARDEGNGDEDEDEPVLDEATRRRLALEERIENIGKKNRVVRRKKKTGDDVDIVDSYHDEICIRLRDRMLLAAEKDTKANENKLPATSKLAMLDEVVNALQNTTLWSSIIDNEVLKAVKVWLEPLPDRSLPAVGIQNAIFEVLPKMDLDTPTIREAQLGPIVLFYTKTKRVTASITRQADALVQTWSRPIIKRPADYRSKYVAHASDERDNQPGGDDGDVDMDDDDETPRQRPRPSKPSSKPRRFDVRAALAENETRKGASLPKSNDIQYTIAPESRVQHNAEDMKHVSRIQRDNRKFNRFANQMKGRK
ncbi:Transcription factor IWS1 [Vanrija pseudolonga]|uniref:Transcription factor IWS1 n=1 Tax=Vanrija pseudolonga TaxID=143232 RepID=A0AAF0YHI0_9TREE|nr:Transcription factor IWS1 [Vanrija pseudolonga]